MPYIRADRLKKLLNAGQTLAHYAAIMNENLSIWPKHEKNGVRQAEEWWKSAREKLYEPVAKKGAS